MKNDKKSLNQNRRIKRTFEQRGLQEGTLRTGTSRSQLRKYGDKYSNISRSKAMFRDVTQLQLQSLRGHSVKNKEEKFK